MIHVKDAGVWKPVSDSSPRGGYVFDRSGTFTVPEGVYSICAVVIGPGGVGQRSLGSKNGGGGGGGLAWGNDIPVTPGQVLNVNVNASATNLQTDWLVATAGQGGHNANALGGTSSGIYRQGGGNGGMGNSTSIATGNVGGGGAGGYTGDGGNGGTSAHLRTDGSGGGGAGGNGQATTGQDNQSGQGGGGVGLFGEGWSGVNNGGGGSGGTFGSNNGTGGNFGGGAGGKFAVSGSASPPGGGAVRIIWGKGRAFPSTDVGPA